MTRSTSIDVERLAALIDGKLGDAEAAEVRAQLAAADDETISAFADIVAVAAAMEKPDDEQGGAPLKLVTPTRPRPPRFRMFTGAAALAIAAAAVVMVQMNRAPSYQAAAYAVALSDQDVATPSFTWSTSRGAAGALTSKSVAARVGVLLFDIEWRSKRGDDVKTPMLTLAALLSGVAGDHAVVDEIRANAEASSTTEARQALGKRALALVNTDVADVAGFLAAVRVASASGDSAFLVNVNTADVEKALASTAFSTAERSAISTVLNRLRQSPRNWNEVATASEQALQQLTL